MKLIRTSTGRRYEGDGLSDLIAGLERDGTRDGEALEIVTVVTTLDRLREAQGRSITVRGTVEVLMSE